MRATYTVPCRTMEPDAAEIRVLGCLIEKQRTTPDVYPLSLNALRLACNQATNRHPVVDYDEETVREALRRLALRGWTRLASNAGSRARKYRHLLDDNHTPEETAALAVLMLRGVQTPGELKQRTERMQGFPDLAAVNETLERLTARGAVERLARRPGQKEERYRHLLGGDGEVDASPEAGEESAQEMAAPLPPPPNAGEDRLSNLEAEVAELREQVAALREALGD